MPTKKSKTTAKNTASVSAMGCDVCGCGCCGGWGNVSWVLLLIGGLAHVMPARMMPLLNFQILGVSLQLIIGVASVIVAIYCLLCDKK